MAHQPPLKQNTEHKDSSRQKSSKPSARGVNIGKQSDTLPKHCSQDDPKHYLFSSSDSEDELTKNPSSHGVSTEDQTEDTSTQKNDNDPQQLLFPPPQILMTTTVD